MTGYPEVPEDRLTTGGWELRGRTEDVLFRTPTAEVVGRTLLYDDPDQRAALERAGTGDRLATTDAGGGSDRLVATGEGSFSRFFFATALSVRPPLAPGIGPASMRPTVVREARNSFADDLRARGFEDVERGRSQRVRTESGARARLAKYTATLPVTDGPDGLSGLDVEGWLAVWTRGSAFRIAGGAYPTRGLDALLSALPAAERPPTDPGAFRDDLLRLVRGVE